MRLTLAVPPGFSFRQTVCSHGWCLLAPFTLAADRASLSGVAGLPGGGGVPFRLSTRGERVVVDSPGTGDGTSRRLLRQTARRVLGLDVDLAQFHAAVRRVPGLEWIAERHAGRLLRAPTAFEDLVKLVLTTNCHWAFTTRMVGSLVARYGAPAGGQGRAFPTPEALARAGTRALRERCKTGYRAAALAELARRVADGRLDPEVWERDARDPLELRRELLRLPGVGP